MSAETDRSAKVEPREQGSQPAEAPASDASASRPAPGNGVVEDGPLPPVAATGARVEALPSGPDAPDSLNEMVNPASASTADQPLRVSTILGPLPGRVTMQKTRDLNDAVHGILIVGLAISSALLVFGLALALLASQPPPTALLSPAAAIQACLALQPAGFLSLGLIVLLITPITRVIGSVIVFAWERDWVYTVVTLTVLVVMVISIMVGRG